MSDKVAEKLDEISEKMDLLISLTELSNSLIKLSNQTALIEIRNKVNADEVSSMIFKYADGTRSYGELAREISYELGKAEITIKKKISEMKELGILTISKKGKETYYERSGVLK